MMIYGTILKGSFIRSRDGLECEIRFAVTGTDGDPRMAPVDWKEQVIAVAIEPPPPVVELPDESDAEIPFQYPGTVSPGVAAAHDGRETDTVTPTASGVERSDEH
jgi:hypothetical protein